MSDTPRTIRPATQKELASAAIAERVAVILGLAVALRLIIMHSISGMWLIVAAIALMFYAFSVYRRRV